MKIGGTGLKRDYEIREKESLLQVNGFKTKHRRKCIRKWKEIIKLVIGKDMGLEDVNNMTNKSLNGF